MIISLTQGRKIPYDREKLWDGMTSEEQDAEPFFKFRGGCTLILNLQDLTLRYAIVKDLEDRSARRPGGRYDEEAENRRLSEQRDFRMGEQSQTSLRATYFGDGTLGPGAEPFAMLHDTF